MYGGRQGVHRPLHYSAIEWREADRAYRRLARLKKVFRKSGLTTHPPAPPIRNDNEEIFDEHGEVQSISSDDTLASDREETEPTMFINLLRDLVRAERIRRKTEPAVASLRERIKISQYSIDKVMADLRHLSKAHRQFQTSTASYPSTLVGLRAKKERTLHICIQDRQALLTQMYDLETQLSTAIAVQDDGEPRMCRASQGFIRGLDVDIEEEIVPRNMRHWLRFVADWSRSPLWTMSRFDHGPTAARMVNAETDGEIRLNAAHEAALRRENHHELMRRFYRDIESVLTANGDIQPETAPVQGQLEPVRAGPSDNVPKSQSAQLLRELAAARKCYQKSYDDLKAIRKQYKDGLEDYVLTYRVEPEPEEGPDEQSPDNGFDRDFITRIQAGNEDIRMAESRLRYLRNEALELKVFDPEENGLFGVLDHADDGFTETLGSSARARDDLIAAERWPGIHQWLQTAEGSPREDVETPSETADLEVGASVRSAISCLEPCTPPYGVIERWKAEMVVTRAEAQERWREHYQLLGVPAPRGIY